MALLRNVHRTPHPQGVRDTADYRRNGVGAVTLRRAAGVLLGGVIGVLSVFGLGAGAAAADTVGRLTWHYYTYPAYDNTTADPGGARLAYPAVVLPNGTADGQVRTVSRYYGAEDSQGAIIFYPNNGHSADLVWSSAYSRWEVTGYSSSADALPAGLGLAGDGYVLLCESPASADCEGLRQDNAGLSGATSYTGASWASLLDAAGSGSATSVVTSSVSGLGATVLGSAGVLLPLAVVLLAVGLGWRLTRRFVRA